MMYFILDDEEVVHLEVSYEYYERYVNNASNILYIDLNEVDTRKDRDVEI